MMSPPASWPASSTSRRPSWTVRMFDQGRNSSPTLVPAWRASSASPANSATQRSWSQGSPLTSGATLTWRAPSAPAASRSFPRTSSDRRRRGPSAHQSVRSSSSRWTRPLSSSSDRIPARPCSRSATSRSTWSSPIPRNPAAAAASTRSRSGSGLRSSPRSGAASPAVVQQVASRSWSGIGSLPWRLGRAGPDHQAGRDQLGPALGAGLADAVQQTLGGGGPDGRRCRG